MKTIQIEIETKKGEKRMTTWGLTQDHPWPSLGGSCGRLAWQDNNIFPRYGQPAAGLGNKYYATLLRSDWTPENSNNNRLDYAGYVEDRSETAAPGSITLRGKSMGETSATIGVRPDSNYCSWKVRGFDAPTPGEVAFLRTIESALVSGIRENEKSLRQQAIIEIKESIDNQIDDARLNLDKLQIEADEAKKKLV